MARNEQPQEYFDRPAKVHIVNDQAAREFVKDRLVQRVRKLEHDAAEIAEKVKNAKDPKAVKDAALDQHLRRRSPGNLKDK